MTYCLGIALPAGLVLASDSRTNAGIDQIAFCASISAHSALRNSPGRTNKYGDS